MGCGERGRAAVPPPPYHSHFSFSLARLLFFFFHDSWPQSAILMVADVVPLPDP